MFADGKAGSNPRPSGHTDSTDSGDRAVRAVSSHAVCSVTWSVPSPPHAILEEENPMVVGSSTRDQSKHSQNSHNSQNHVKGEGDVVRRLSKDSNDSKISDTDGAAAMLLPTRRMSQPQAVIKMLKSEAEESMVPARYASKVVPVLKKLTSTLAYKVLSATCLTVALFGGPAFVLFDVSDDPAGTIVQDALMIFVLVVFIVEIMIETSLHKSYFFSFFFCMDLVGTVSMVFEISFLLGTHGKINVRGSEVNGVILRSTRAAKLGARAARLSKLVKCFTFMKRGSDRQIEDAQDHDAYALKARLTHSLSTKVSMLTLALVLGIPFFNTWTYPQEDLSMNSWARTLELDYARAYDILVNNDSSSSADLFLKTVAEMVEFYQGTDYYPYRLEGYGQSLVISGRQVSIPGASLAEGPRPNRAQNIYKQAAGAEDTNRRACANEVKPGFCEQQATATLYFDFTDTSRQEAATEIGMVIFVILCMVLESFDLSRTLDYLVVAPVERILSTIHLMARLLSKVELANIAADDEPTDDEILNDAGAMREAKLLERVFRRLRAITKDFQRIVEEEALVEAGDNRESQGVLFDLLQIQRSGSDMPLVVHTNTFPTSEGDFSVLRNVVKDLPIAADVIESWDLELLNMERPDLCKVLLYIFFDSKVGHSTGRIFLDTRTFKLFHDTARDAYFENPYHNYVHACDVVSTIFRIFNQVKAHEWLSDIDMYALLISALCHDIGHPGRTNPFLVERMDDLAVRYNDKSPLENMHCAKLFEICSTTSTNVFRKLDKDAFKQARKVCINSILHTDNALHFEMVKQVQSLYGETKSLCDAQAKQGNAYLPEYLEEVMCKEPVLWHKLLLHMSDVSSPLKPFRINRAWATLVQDEFFVQGDEEKKLGMPVGFLNDREKVSRSGAEHGFITFLVAPLVLATVSVQPQTLGLSQQMVANLQEWKEAWVKEAKPSPEEVKKRETDIQKFREQVEQLGERRSKERNSVGRRSVHTAFSIHSESRLSLERDALASPR